MTSVPADLPDNQRISKPSTDTGAATESPPNASTSPKAPKATPASKRLPKAEYVAVKPKQLGDCPEFILREHTKTDEGLIYSSWIKGAYEVSPTNFIPREIYLKKQAAHIDACLATHTTYVLCHVDDPDQIFGYICFSMVADTLLIHWLYVRGGPGLWRNRGIARTLLSELYPDYRTKPIIITQYSKHVKSLRNWFNIVYDPYYNIDHIGA